MAVTIETVCLFFAILGGCVANHPHAARIERLRAAGSSIPEPTDLEHAKQLHAQSLQAAANIQRLHGHSTINNAITQSSSLLSPGFSNYAATRVINPLDYGADPTGTRDSTQAMQTAMKALLSVNVTAPKMASGIHDLGGAVLDLQGGTYLISESLVIPTFFGNCHIVRGTLRATPSFPPTDYMIQIGQDGCKPDNQKSCNEFIEISEILLDAAHQAAGCVYIASTMGTTLGPAIFFHGFNESGVHVVGSHEVMILEAWLSEYYWNEGKPATSNSIGILLDGNDHLLTNVIVFAFTRVGVRVNGAANILTAVHTWNGGGIGIDVSATNTRLLGCYLDYNYLRLNDPDKVVVESTFFLQTTVYFNAISGKAADTVLRFNSFTGGQPNAVVNGTFPPAQVSNVQVVDDFGNTKHTTATKVVNTLSGTQAEFDFADDLLFPHGIESVQYSVVRTDADTTAFAHSARLVNQTAVMVSFPQGSYLTTVTVKQAI